MTPSWRLKLQRAEEHLVQIKEMLPPDTERKSHPVREWFDGDEAGGAWNYTLALSYEPREWLFVVIGDFLFDVRSALDHLAAACVAPSARSSVQFPIFWQDPIAIDPISGGHVNSTAWKAWKGRTRPFADSGVLPVIQLMQPFEIAKNLPAVPEDHVLSILSMLHDTDKHQRFLMVPNTLFKIAITIDGVTDWLVPGMQDGELLWQSGTRAAVEVEGALRVAVGTSRDKLRDIPRLFDDLLNCIANDVVPPLEDFLRLRLTTQQT